MPQVTVIIPSYNMQNGTAVAIDSVLRQDIPVQVIIVDDNSEPPLILPQNLMDTGRVKVMRQEKNIGPAAARNLGIGICNTEWISFLDADDVLLPNTLGARLQYAKQATQNIADNAQKPIDKILANALICCGWIETDNTSGGRKVRIPNQADKLEEFTSGCWYSPGSTALVHRSVFEESNRAYNEGIRRFEDFEWGIRFGKSGGQLIVQPKACVEIYPSNRTNSKIVGSSSQHILESSRQILGADKSAFRSVNAYLALEQMTNHIREKNWIAASWATLRTYYWKPRIKRHFSPGWTYKEWRGTRDS